MSRVVICVLPQPEKGEAHRDNVREQRLTKVMFPQQFEKVWFSRGHTSKRGCRVLFWHRRASIEGCPWVRPPDSPPGKGVRHKGLGLSARVCRNVSIAMIAGNANTTSSLIPAGPRKGLYFQRCNSDLGGTR